MTQKAFNPWLFDVRVRERNMKSGALTEKELEKHLGGLTDVAEHAEAFGLPQPALAQPAAHAAVGDQDDDDGDDEDDEVEASEA